MTDDTHTLFRIYLQDHHAAAAGGRALAQRCAESNSGTPLGEFLNAELIPAIDVDTDVLERIFDVIQSSPSVTKRVAARAAEYLGRFKMNGRIKDYSPLSRVIELEGLIAGVEAKRRLWEAVEITRERNPGTDLPDPCDRAALADGHIEHLKGYHADACLAAFGGAAFGDVDQGNS